MAEINDQYEVFLRMMDLIERGELDTLLEEFQEEVSK